MTDYQSDLEQLDVQLSSLGGSISATSDMTAQFNAELSGMQAGLSLAQKESRGLSHSLSRGLRSAFGDLVFEGAKLSDVLGNVARSMIKTSFNRAVSPVTDALSGALTSGLGGLFSGLVASADGNAFSSGRVVPFAKGGVVSGATVFPMRGATGLMGEAGPEAIMPLARGPDGALGVRSSGRENVTINMNITTPDADSFRRSQTQIAAGMSRAMQRGNRNH